MVTRFDDFFVDLVGPQRVHNFPGRFEWRRGHLRTESGNYYMITIPDQEKPERQVFQYLIDNATNKSYIAHNPIEMGPNFFIAAIVTPIVLCGTIVVQFAKLVVTSIKVAYQTFREIYPHKEEEIASLTLKSFERNLTWQKEEIFLLIEEMFNSFKFAAGLEIAALYGALFFQDDQTICKMQVIFAEIESLWNHEVDYKQTPFSYSLRFKKLLEEGFSVQEAFESLNIEEMKPSFYTLQCCQARHRSCIVFFEDHFSSYDEMQGVIREEAERHAQQQRPMRIEEV